MVTDPIADFLVRLQNASAIKKDRVSMPYSKMKFALAELLSREGYVGKVAANTDAHSLQIELRYNGNRPAINGSKRISKPSRRLYSGMRSIRPVKHGHGLLVLSTPKGVLTGKQAREHNVGGETLFEIW